MLTTQATEINLERERSLIGKTILYPEELRNCSLAAEDFEDAACKKAWTVFRRWCDLPDADEPQYRKMIQDAGISNSVYAAFIDAPYVQSKNVNAMVRKLKQQSADNKAVRWLLPVLQREDCTGIASELIEFAGQLKADSVVESESPESQVETVLKELREDKIGKRIFTPWQGFNSITGGLQLGSVSVFGAFPSAGKTALALNMLSFAAAHGFKSLFFSLEMTVTQLWYRLASSNTGVSYHALLNENLSQDDGRQIEKYLTGTAETNLIQLFDKYRIIEDITSHIASIRPQFVIIDYLQQVSTKEKMTNTFDRVEFIVQEAKRAAIEYGCHILFLSQLNREASTSGRLSMFNMKGGSGIEQGGDVVAILERPHVQDKEQPECKAALRINKNKFGQTGGVKLWFDGEIQQFRDLRNNETYPLPDCQEVNPIPDWEGLKKMKHAI